MTHTSDGPFDEKSRSSLPALHALVNEKSEGTCKYLPVFCSRCKGARGHSHAFALRAPAAPRPTPTRRLAFTWTAFTWLYTAARGDAPRSAACEHGRDRRSTAASSGFRLNPFLLGFGFFAAAHSFSGFEVSQAPTPFMRVSWPLTPFRVQGFALTHF